MTMPETDYLLLDEIFSFLGSKLFRDEWTSLTASESCKLWRDCLIYPQKRCLWGDEA
jgi:hypothetical protein